MHQWNEQQPNEQGLASNFDAYFKAHTDVEKEVHGHYSQLEYSQLTSTPFASHSRER